MTKKIFFILSMMMLGITTMSAQSIIGKWAADEDFIKEMELEDKDGKIDIVLNIAQRTISIDVLMNMDDDGDLISMVYSIPGTYTKVGNKVTAKFDEKKADLKVTDIQTNDPDMKAMMKTEEGKKAVLSLVNTMVKSEVAESMKDIAEITTIFQTFTIEGVTAKKLSIKALEEVPVSFNRTK